MAFKNVNTLKIADLKSFFDSFDNVMCDTGGTLWTHNTAFLGVPETISILKKSGKRIYLVANSSMSGIDDMVKHAKQLNIEIDRNDIIIPSLAMIAYLKNIKFDKEVFVLGSQVLKQTLLDAKIKVANKELDMHLNSYEELVDSIQDNLKIGAVLFDFDLNLNYRNLLKAICYLKRPEVLYLIGTDDKKLWVGPHKSLEGQLEFQNLLTEVTGKSPIRFGKPSLYLNEYITNTYTIQRDRTLFIGDSLQQDIAFAMNCGYQNMLVLTGVTSYPQAELAKSEVYFIDYHINSLGELYKLLKWKLNILQETREYVESALSALNLYF